MTLFPLFGVLVLMVLSTVFALSGDVITGTYILVMAVLVAVVVLWRDQR